MSAALDIVRALRPRHWVKNLFVFAPFFFSEGWTKGGPFERVVKTFAIFCLLSSAVYLLNDVLDREADRVHPQKRHRPVASGRVPVPLALTVSALLMAGALAWIAAPGPFGLHSKQVFAACGAYLAIQIAYSVWLKRVVILDVMCIASGFVLRLLAGGEAAWVPQSPWILVCTIFLSLFLALAKRRHEVVTLGADAHAHRAILADYPPALLDQLISAATACTLVTYTLYTVDPRTAVAHGLVHDGQPAAWLALTVPFVVFGVFRYLYIVYRRDGGGSPTDTVLRDAQLLAACALYAATVLAVFSLA